MRRVTAAQLKGLPVGDHDLGKGLWITKTAVRSRFFYRYGTRKVIIGSYPTMSLPDARATALKFAKVVEKGSDPLYHRVLGSGETFAYAAQSFWALKCQHLQRSKEWLSSMETHIFPVIGDVRCDALTRTHLINIFEPIWHTSFARTMRHRVANVITHAADNDDTVKRDLMQDVARVLGPQRIERVRRSALSMEDAPALWRQLPDTVPGRALRLCLLTGTGAEAVRDAEWYQIDLHRRVWHGPGGEVIPLTDAALAVIGQPSGDAFSPVFASPRGTRLSSNAMYLTMREIGAVTANGVRWAFQEFRAERGEGAYAAWSDFLTTR